MSTIMSVVSTWVFLACVVLAFSKAINTWDQTRSDFYRAMMGEKDE